MKWTLCLFAGLLMSVLFKPKLRSQVVENIGIDVGFSFYGGDLSPFPFSVQSVGPSIGLHYMVIRKNKYSIRLNLWMDAIEGNLTNAKKKAERNQYVLQDSLAMNLRVLALSAHLQWYPFGKLDETHRWIPFFSTGLGVLNSHPVLIETPEPFIFEPNLRRIHLFVPARIGTEMRYHSTFLELHLTLKYPLFSDQLDFVSEGFDAGANDFLFVMGLSLRIQ